MEELSVVQRIAIWVLPILFAITVHEVAHGWMALRFGDHTAQMMGRLTLNPIHHIDPIGTLLVPGILLMLGGVVFGWAKPVPVSWDKLRNPQRDMAIVALAGPMANLVMAILWAIISRIGIALALDFPMIGLPLAYMGIAGMFINAILMMLNLIPLPPLDGGRVLVGVLPGPLAYKVSRVEPYGFFILLGLLFTGALWYVLWPLVDGLLTGLVYFVGVPKREFFGGLLTLMGAH
ncbi:site-2 protease family protein [Nitrosococcus wardiae]|uniref:Site-2 protease family protein n=1 Tax=Nitrosococcus wardiae TaxID=1814290 RepID=A0A4V1AVK7_9GAMM|nr:site-2 protease family protein [Nitrosococcus wardiae]QBQ53475.1 site-2 protease family protein [Nitrosococcus wardiae]